ncbi:uncharacterized protein AMSG_11280 [Thecamonas trahens ATCC 50062]|uniref:Uncharacterized protein n=1 Tax=Thecamonas trahens ATCC 50062 TaxID=461836 RepID=A0A0L0DU32_THETB|nr:hypothetical protein AMSG_11280 [Thecamonas trahens ATCC 50062]KNC55839.1 hypothetical protein AMSG_11280 [Thecamonas trahens ATCC 50062]|eukprot:XP_013752816.1 hypothetical protein AMSG_11280 [Thecamonas trahens ATCC 50062]
MCVSCHTQLPRSSYSSTQWSRPPEYRACRQCAAAAAYGALPIRQQADVLLAKVHALHSALKITKSAHALGNLLKNAIRATDNSADGATAPLSDDMVKSIVLLSCGHFAWEPQLLAMAGHCVHGCLSSSVATAPAASSSSTTSSSPGSSALARLSAAASSLDSPHPVYLLGRGQNHQGDALAAALDVALAIEGVDELLAKLAALHIPPSAAILVSHFEHGSATKAARVELESYISAGMVDTVAELAPYGVKVVFLRCKAWLLGEVIRDIDNCGDTDDQLGDGADLAVLSAQYHAAADAVAESPVAASLFASERTDFVAVVFSYTNLAAAPPPATADDLVVHLPRDATLAQLWSIMIGKYIVDAGISLPCPVIHDVAGRPNTRAVIVTNVDGSQAKVDVALDTLSIDRVRRSMDAADTLRHPINALHFAIAPLCKHHPLMVVLRPLLA